MVHHFESLWRPNSKWEPQQISNIAQLLSYSVTQLLSYSVTQLLSYSVTQLLSCRLPQQTHILTVASETLPGNAPDYG